MATTAEPAPQTQTAETSSQRDEGLKNLIKYDTRKAYEQSCTLLTQLSVKFSQG